MKVFISVDIWLLLFISVGVLRRRNNVDSNGLKKKLEWIGCINFWYIVCDESYV